MTAMAIRPILTEENPLLRQRAREILSSELGTETFARLIEDMIETMRHANGVGIAAPQIGESIRLFIADSGHGPIALVNPVIVERSKKMARGEEGCLSVPKRFEMVERHKSVKVRALSLSGENVAFEARDFFARIIQHEHDHVEGVLFIDRFAEQQNIKR